MAKETDQEMTTTTEKDPSPKLRETISKIRAFLCRTVTTARAHSPLADDKLEAADEAVSSVIHRGYQYVKRIAVQGDPAVILSLSGLAAAVPSIPFGGRAIVRNTGLAVAMAAIMIYPDHLSSQAPPKKTELREKE